MRIDWPDLPAAVRDTVQERTGQVSAVRIVPEGLNCATAAVLTTARGRVFVKGALDGAAVAGQTWEADINRHVRAVGPRLRRRATAHEWDLVAFDAVDGRHTDLNPHNILIGRSGSGRPRAYLVDWATPARGPAWVDVAYVAVRMMEANCQAEVARSWAWRSAAWRAAPVEAVRAWLEAHCRQWTAQVGETDARPSNERYRALLG